MLDRLGRPSEPLRQRRGVVVRVGVRRIEAHRLLVGEERLGQAAEVLLRDTCDGVRWSVRGGDFSIDVTVRAPDGAIADLACDPIAGTCVGANVGLSPNHRGVLEAARMDPSRRSARAVTVDALESTFIAGFTSAAFAPSYLMKDIDVAWARDRAPRLTTPVAA